MFFVGGIVVLSSKARNMATFLLFLDGFLDYMGRRKPVIGATLRFFYSL